MLSELLAHKLPKARNLLDKSKGKPTGHKNAAVKQHVSISFWLTLLGETFEKLRFYFRFQRRETVCRSLSLKSAGLCLQSSGSKAEEALCFIRYTASRQPARATAEKFRVKRQQTLPARVWQGRRFLVRWKGDFYWLRFPLSHCLRMFWVSPSFSLWLWRLPVLQRDIDKLFFLLHHHFVC